MKQADFSVLRKCVLDVIKDSVVGERVRDVVLEADRDDDGSDFLRVILEVNSLDGVSDADIEDVVDAIETAIAELDERSPSVRIADAA
jgi:hypothetical protein